MLVAPELRNVDYNPATDAPFGPKLPTLKSVLDWLIPPKLMPVLTAWGLLADRVYPWTAITWINSRTTGTNTGPGFNPLLNSYDDNTRPDRESHVEFQTPGGYYNLSGPYMPMLEGLPQLLPRYQWLATRPLALDLAGQTILPPGPGSFARMLEAARTAAPPLLENVAGYRENRTRLSAHGKTVLTNALLYEPTQADPGMLAAVIAALYGATELADEIGQCILSPDPLFAATAKVAASKLGMGAIVTGQPEEVTPFLHPADAQALRAW
jgi:hypothetical protein